MEISDSGIALIKSSEGFSAQVYEDNGHQAIGYGHDLKPGESFPGGVTQAEAELMLRADVAEVAAVLNQMVPAGCTQGQFDALCDFGFNLGIGSLKEMMAHGWYQVPLQIPRWNHVDGVENLGLTARRAAEVAMWNA